MHTADFDFILPERLIAQHPLPQRDASRLLVLDRASGEIAHRAFPDLLDYLRMGDILVLNNSRVIPARLRGANARTGGEFEILLLEENSLNDWWCMVRPGKRARLGARILLHPPKGSVPHIYTSIEAVVIEINEEGHRRLRFELDEDIAKKVDEFGEVPLPPYIRREPGASDESDRERYQTVYAQDRGSVAAPTAGLHFTDSLLEQIRERGAQVCSLTLHVGPGTFAPVKSQNISAHKMHEERFDVPEPTARAINAAKAEGRRVLAVGTTTLRVIESLARDAVMIRSGRGRTNIFIYPPFQFKIVDVLLTNFHLPRSTLLMLVSAFAAPSETRGRDLILSAYSAAISERYRFFSYGDAMLIF